MGRVLAANLVASGHDVVAHDVAGAEGCPEGAVFAPDVRTVAADTDVVVCSLPDGGASEAVARAIAGASERRAAHVVDTSTIGVEAARHVAGLLAADGISYVDAPVSGGVAGAHARTLTVMYAGADEACAAVDVVLAGLSDRLHRVGDRPGLAQALKLANNFLSATALAATSEAVAFGVAAGLDMETMVNVLNAGSGQSAATSDKFVNHVLTGRFASGFANSLMAKDLRLYLGAVEAQGAPSVLGPVTAAVWERFETDEPGVDFTRIYPFVAEKACSGAPQPAAEDEDTVEVPGRSVPHTG
jgi:3-hydroxyisobutyrate dehydrogenase-like beta-hydroxyacid dehydrogenase